MSFLTYNERCARLVLDRLELYRLHCGLITSFKSNYGFNCLRSEDFFTLCGKQITRGHPFELILENVSLICMWLPFGTNCRPRFLMWLLSLLLLQSFAGAI